MMCGLLWKKLQTTIKFGMNAPHSLLEGTKTKMSVLELGRYFQSFRTFLKLAEKVKTLLF